MFSQKLDVVKYYRNLYWAKRFIQRRSVFYSSLILFVKKLDKWIWFCVEYWRLNAITQKDQYLIPLTEDTLGQLKDAKYYIKIDNRQVCYQIRISENWEELITFLTRFNTFKHQIILFGICNKLSFWQHPINDSLFNFLHCFIHTYLYLIFINSKTLDDNYSYVC